MSKNKLIFDLDEEEQELSDSFARGEWDSVRDFDKVARTKYSTKKFDERYIHQKYKKRKEME